jgi:transposase
MAYTLAERRAALERLSAGESIEEVSMETGISLPTLFRWKREPVLSDEERSRRDGRKPLLDADGREALRALVEENGNRTLKELVTALAERTGKTLGEETVRRTVKSLGYRKLKVKKAPSKPAPQTAPRYTKAHRREPTATAYPSTLTDSEWAVLEPLLAKTDARGRPPTHDKRVLMNAIFYQVRTGAPWRYLPKDFPHWSAVWSLFRRLRDSGKLEEMYDALHGLWRESIGRSRSPTAGIVDSQTVKTTEKGGLAATTQGRS